MKRKFEPAIIGIFVIGSAILLIVAIAVFGSGKMFSDSERFVTVFPGSVKGLSNGAPVTLNGARVGSVTATNVFYESKSHTTSVHVIFEVNFNQIQGLPTIDKSLPIQERVLAHGIFTRLEMDSFVTGQKSIALELRPELQAELPEIRSEYPQLPALPSTLDGLSDKLESLPLGEIADSLRNTLKGADKIVNSPGATDALKEVSTFFKDGNLLIKDIDSQIVPLATESRKILQELDTAITTLDMPQISADIKEVLSELKFTMNALDEFVADDSALQYNLNRSLNELSAAAREVRELADYLKRNPEALIQGKHPEKNQ